MTERMSAAEAFDLLAQQSKPDKRRVRGTRRVQYGGKWFDSIKERDQFILLKDREKNGLIKDLRCQVPFILNGKNRAILTPSGRAMQYIADFMFWDVEQDRLRIQDAKGGYITDIAQMKLAIMAAQGFHVEVV